MNNKLEQFVKELKQDTAIMYDNLEEELYDFGHTTIDEFIEDERMDADAIASVNYELGFIEARESIIRKLEYILTLK